jgi:saccharopine dehydrogenase-like NADP-dependent oxidoreductase
MDMAMTLSEPHPTDPFHMAGIKLGDYQFNKAKDWEQKKLLAMVGFGVEPGMADVFARYAQDYLFDEIDEIGIRDGSNLDEDMTLTSGRRSEESRIMRGQSSRSLNPKFLISLR